MTPTRTPGGEALGHYLEQGATWEHGTYQGLMASRRRAWLVAAVASGIAVLSLAAVVLMLPLKEFAPYVVTHDKATGMIEVTQGLQPGDLTEDEAITQANIVQCLTARETYDATDLQSNVAYAGQCLSDQARADLFALYDDGNATAPQKIYGFHTTVSVQIKSVQLLSPTTAHVRFQTTKTRGNETEIEHWISAIAFRYVQKRESLTDRFVNPLGFQIHRYRRDQEIVHD